MEAEVPAEPAAKQSAGDEPMEDPDNNTDGIEPVAAENPDGNIEESQSEVQYVLPTTVDTLGKIMNESSSRHPNNFVCETKWSPDGSLLMTVSSDNTCRLYDALTLFSVEGEQYKVISNSVPTRLPEGETIYSTCWFPGFRRDDESTCVFATSSRDHPVHLWDAITGQLRGSYRVYDHMDELDTMISTTFGRIYDSRKTLTKDGDGQRGLISCLHSNPDFSGMVAAGCFDKTVGVYTEDLQQICVLRGHVGGVTQVQFSRCGYFLYSAARKDSDILCWDLRNTLQVLNKFSRDASTNQRISFDFDATGQVLMTGGKDGTIHGYSVANGEEIFKSTISSSCVNSTAIHPMTTVAAFGSGERTFTVGDTSSDEDDVDVVDNAVHFYQYR